MREKQHYLVFSALFVGVACGWSSPSRCFPLVQSRRCTSISAATAAGVPDFSTPSVLRSSDAIATPTTDWIVYVDHSKPSLEKGAAATLDAFLGLTTAAATARSGRTATTVAVKAAFLPKPKKGGQPATPWVRCVSLANNIALEIYGVDSVDKGISRQSCRCLQYKYKASGFLEAGKVSLAIETYQKALDAASNDPQQEGVILYLRAAAYLQRAAQHRDELRDIVQELISMVPSPPTLVSLLDVAHFATPLSTAVFRRILQDSQRQDLHFRSTQYRHGLYQYALLQAAQDALRATQVLPAYAQAWVRAGDILGELWKLPEAVSSYERAMALDDAGLRPTLMPVIARLQRRQELLIEARTYRWSEDTLRLALDVAG